MKQAFYYADLDLTVTLVDGKADMVKTLHPGEVQLLSLQFHSVIVNFIAGRALYAIPLIDKDKYDYLKDEGSDDNE